MSSFEYQAVAQIILSEDQKPISTPGGSSISVTNPFLHLNVPFLRTTQTFSVSILIAGLSNESPKNFTFNIVDKVAEPENILFDVQGELPVYNGPGIGGLNINMDLKNIILTHEGKHSAVLYLGEKEISHTDFYVVINEQM